MGKEQGACSSREGLKPENILVFWRYWHLQHVTTYKSSYMAMAENTHLSSQVSLDPLWFSDGDDDWRPVLVSHFLPGPQCLHQSQTSLWLEREFSHNIATTVTAAPLMFLIFFIFVIFSNSFQGKLRRWTHLRKMLCARPQPTLSLVGLSETWKHLPSTNL